jgi:hypothetical protein
MRIKHISMYRIFPQAIAVYLQVWGMLSVFMSPKSRKKRLLTNHYVELFWRFCKTYFFCGIPFRSVPFRFSELALPRKSECLGMSTFFRGIRETIPSLFRGIFSERNSVPNPTRGNGWRCGGEGHHHGPRAALQISDETLRNYI